MRGNPSNLLCTLFNARSITSKLHLLHSFLAIRNPDIVFITETWLNSKILNSELVGGHPYNVVRSDRSGHKGVGVCCLVKHGLLIYPTGTGEQLYSDLICFDVRSKGSPCSTRFILLYRPPGFSVEEDTKLIDSIYVLCSAALPVILLGDFNLTINWLKNRGESSRDESFRVAFANCQLKQMVSSPTRNNSILDLVLSSNPIIYNLCIAPPFGNSDHNMIFFELSGVQDNSLYLPEPMYNRVDYNRLNCYLEGVDWCKVFCGYSDIDGVYYRFCLVLYQLFAKVVPFRYQRVGLQQYPPYLRNLFEQKSRLFSRLSRPLVHPLYKKVCSEINRHIKRYTAYRERRLLASNKRALFSYLRTKIKGTSEIPVLKDQAGCFLHTDQDKANALGKYFASVFDNATHVNDLGGMTEHQLDYRLSDLSSGISVVRPSEVLHILKRLKSSLSATYDGIPQAVFQKCANTLQYPLAMIFNISLAVGKVPKIRKDSIVTPITKKSDAHLLSDFRPISICLTSEKVLEKLVRDKLSDWFIKHHIIPKEQHGFTSAASTKTLICGSLYDWHTALNDGKSVDIIYFDLSKAFDRVCHRLLLQKLIRFGICDPLLIWLSSYLYERHMTVKIGNSYSDRYLCSSGVP